MVSKLKKLSRTAFPFFLMLVLLLPGCATDQQRTVTEGTSLGAIAGGVLGAAAFGGLAALNGGNARSIAAAAAAGAVAGGTLGGIYGYNRGKAIARKKASYASNEAFLDDNIKDTLQMQRDARADNLRLRTQIAQMKQQSLALLAAYRQNRVTRDQVASAGNNVGKQRAQLQQRIAGLNEEIHLQRNVVSSATPTPTTSAKLEQIQTEIQALSQEKQELEVHQHEMESISNRLSV